MPLMPPASFRASLHLLLRSKLMPKLSRRNQQTTTTTTTTASESVCKCRFGPFTNRDSVLARVPFEVSCVGKEHVQILPMGGISGHIYLACKSSFWTPLASFGPAYKQWAWSHRSTNYRSTNLVPSHVGMGFPMASWLVPVVIEGSHMLWFHIKMMPLKGWNASKKKLNEFWPLPNCSVHVPPPSQHHPKDTTREEKQLTTELTWPQSSQLLPRHRKDWLLPPHWHPRNYEGDATSNLGGDGWTAPRPAKDNRSWTKFLRNSSTFKFGAGWVFHIKLQGCSFPETGKEQNLLVEKVPPYFRFYLHLRGACGWLVLKKHWPNLEPPLCELNHWAPKNAFQETQLNQPFRDPPRFHHFWPYTKPLFLRREPPRLLKQVPSFHPPNGWPSNGAFRSSILPKTKSWWFPGDEGWWGSFLPVTPKHPPD